MAKKNNLCFYRDGSQKEIDIIYNIGNHYLPIEIKSAETFTYAANDEQKRQDTYITNPRQMLSYIDALDE